MSTPQTAAIDAIAESIDIPEHLYDKAIDRAKNLEEWIQESAVTRKFSPQISAQGSFRLGTVNRPLTDDDEYDLDLGWLLRTGYDRNTHSQAELKELIGTDLESYRKARQIQAAREEKNRCWRLHYQDEVKFHLDGVPCIPERSGEKILLREAMARQGMEEAQARALSEFSISITDRTRPDYRVVTPHWLVSNPEGYARWFEAQMRQAKSFLESRARLAGKASIDDLPAFKWKTPLQQCVQLLKRHRDIMFAKHRDSQPISIIITTLAARAYRGETDTGAALAGILSRMDTYVSAAKPRVPNPVNPAEDFADKWSTPDGQRLQLEQNFQLWLAQARADFRSIANSSDADFIVQQAQRRLSVTLNAEKLQARLGVSFPAVVPTPKSVQITEPARPWTR